MNSDQQLIQNYLESQSQEAFSELVDRYVRLVWATASRVTQSSLHADDITQQTFLLLAKKANQLVDASNLAGWLHRTTYLLALNQRRADQRRLAHHREAHQIMSNDSTSTDSWREIAPQLDACLQALSERERSFLLMRFFRNFKWSQVAQFHQISEGAAKMQVQRSLQKLRRQLQRSGVLVSSLSLYAGLHANAAPPLEINSLHLVRTAIANRLSGQKGFSGFVRDRGGTLVIASAIIVISFFLGYRGWFHGNGGGPSSYLRGGEGRLEVRMEGDASTLLSRSQPTVAAYRPSVPSAEQALRNAIYNRDLLNGPSCQALEAALKLFGMDGDRAVSILLEALVVPLESSNWGRVVTDT
ncbi:MAG: sigma-70 family RNA polymerase sigma factor, partial [Verrucomicrobia bacterium]|nr:sigma-70 family RNA polymerase sigma factor [Verrucomicrobiota bacterium]